MFIFKILFYASLWSRKAVKCAKEGRKEAAASKVHWYQHTEGAQIAYVGLLCPSTTLEPESVSTT